MHRLRIILEVGAKGLQSGFRSASAAVKGFLGGLKNMVGSGRRALDSLAQSVFFLGHAFGKLKNIASSLFDRFIGGAGSVAKLTTRFKNLTGSQEAAERVMADIRDMSLATGQDMMRLGEAYALMAVNARDASGAFDPDKLKEQADLLQFLAALRPDLDPALIVRAMSAALMGDVSRLEMVMDMPIKAMLKQSGILADVAEDLDKQAQEVGHGTTYIQTGAADQTQKAADEIGYSADQIMAAMEEYIGLDAGAMIEDMAEKSGLERMGAIVDDLADTLGGPLFDALNKFAGTIADMYEQDPEKFRQLADALGDLAAKGLGGLLDPFIEGLSSGFFIAAIEKATKFLELLQAGKVDAAFELFGVGDFAASMGDVIEALGAIAETLVNIAKVLGADVPKGIQAAADAKTVFTGGKAGRAEVAEKWYGQAAGKGQAIVQEAISGPEGMENVKRAVATELANILGINIGQKPQQLEVTIKLDNDLLNAQITQTSEGVVTDSFNQLGEHMKGTH